MNFMRFSLQIFSQNRSLMMLLLCFIPLASFAQHLTCPPFETKNPEVTSQAMYAVAQGGGLIVAVGREQIIVSADQGETFTAANPGAYWFRDVLWSGTHFIACTNSGEVFTSENGLDWTLRIEVPSTQFNTLASSGSIFVAAGRNNIATSTDGINWEEGPLVQGRFNELFWDGVFFKTVGYNTEHLISADGLNWTVTYLGIQDEFVSVAYSGSVYVAAGERQGLIYTSTTSTGWTARPLLGPSLHSRNLSYANGYFFLFASRSIWRSTDGVDWEQMNANGNTGVLQDVIWTGTRYLAFGFGNVIFESLDGTSWTLKNAFTSEYSNRVSWDGNQYVLLNDADQMWRSPHGDVWSKVVLPPNPPDSSRWTDIAHGPSDHLIVGNSSTYLYSQNGVDWESRDNHLDVKFATIDWLDQAWFAVGLDNKVYRSFDGQTWTGYQVSPANSPFYFAHEMVFHEGTFIIAGYAYSQTGFIATSRNLVDWNYQLFENYGRFYDVTWVGDRFLAGAEYGLILQSFDGDIWTPLDNPLEHDIRKIIYNGRDTIVLTEFGSLLRTEDPGGNWTLEDHPAIPYARDMVMQGETILVINGGSSIFKRSCSLCYEADEIPEQIASWSELLDVAALVQIINSPCDP